jgi:glycosyltransferase involved in cell wall biosynthesis
MFAPTARLPRIVHLTTVHQPLDTRIYYKEVRSLADSGFDVRLATTVDQRSTHDGVPLLPLGDRSGARWKRILRDARALLTMYAHRDAILHIHDPELLLAAFLPALGGAKIVFDVHEFYAERIAGSTWIPAPLRRLASSAYDAVERTVLPHFAGVVIVSEAMRPRYERFVGAARVALVRNFPNLRSSDVETARAIDHPLEGTPYVLHTGGAMKLRAFHDIVGAAEALRAQGSALRMVVLGEQDMSEYSAAERDDLFSRAQRAGVMLLGSVPYAEAQRWLAHARIGYLPLIDTENNRRGMPNKLFEYALFGLPVVATRIGRVAEIVDEHGFGKLVPIGDAQAHANAMSEIHENPAMHDALAGRAREAAHVFSFSAEFRALHDLYARICTAIS